MHIFFSTKNKKLNKSDTNHARHTNQQLANQTHP